MVEHTFKKRDPYEALRLPRFKYFLITRFTLVFSWTMQFIIIEWHVYNLTQDPLSLGMIGLMEVIPATVMALFAGHIVDRSEKRNLLLISLILFLLSSICLFFIVSPLVAQFISSLNVIWGIYLIVFIGGLLRAFISPSIFSLFAQVIPKKSYANGATWSSSVWQLGAVSGPAFAGLAINLFGIQWSLFTVILGTSLAIISLLKIPSQKLAMQNQHENLMKSLKEGIAFVLNTKVILGAISLDMFAVLFGGAVALLPIFATDILNVGSTGFGFLRAAPAVGSLLIMLLVAYFPINKMAGKKLLIAVFCFGLSIVVFGLSETYWVSLLALFLSGLADGVSVVIRQTILQLMTPEHMRGRVSAVNSIFVGSSNELGAFESGLTARLFGTVRAVILGGSVTVLISIVTAVGIPSLRRLNLNTEGED